MKVQAWSSLEHPRLSQSCTFGFFLSSDASISFPMTFPPLGNSDTVVLLVSIELISKTSVDITYKQQKHYNIFTQKHILET